MKAAAKQFAQRLLRPQDRIAVVGFNQTTFWLTRFTNDFNAAAGAVDRVKPIGETHLYDTRDRDAVRAAEDARPPRARRPHRRRRPGIEVQARPPRALRALRRRAGLSDHQEQDAVAADALRRRLPRGAQARGHRPRHRRDVLHHPEGERAARPSTAGSPQELRQQYQLVFYSAADGRPIKWHALDDRLARPASSCAFRKGYFP